MGMIYYILASNLITTLYQVSLSSPRQSRHPSSAPAPRPPRQRTRARCRLQRRLGVLRDRRVLHLCPLRALVLKRRDCQHSHGEPGVLLVLTSMTRSCVWPGGAGAFSGAIKRQFLSRHPPPARPAINENDRLSRLNHLWSIISPHHASICLVLFLSHLRARSTWMHLNINFRIISPFVALTG